MATALNNYTYLTLVEIAKRTDPRGGAAAIAEILNQTNEIVQDMVWLEANDTFSHKTTRRLSLPQAEWRKLNQGVGVNASRTMEVIDTMGILEVYAESDVELVNAAPDPQAIRMQEAVAFIEGMGQQLVETVFYGNTLQNPERFTGFAPRLSSVSQLNVYSQGHAAATYNTSIYFVQWAPIRVHMIYPRGSISVGLKHEDLGIGTVFTGTAVFGESTTKQFQAYRDHFQIKAGMAVRDERCIARLCNIGYNSTTSGMNLSEDNIIRILNNMAQRGGGALMYMNREVFTRFDILAKDKTNVQYMPDMPFGLPQIHFRGVPVRLCDQISNSEAVVT